jgi:hypothetical protein
VIVALQAGPGSKLVFCAVQRTTNSTKESKSPEGRRNEEIEMFSLEGIDINKAPLAVEPKPGATRER